MQAKYFLPLILFFLVFLSVNANQQIVLAYQKTYSIFVSGQRVYDFLIYPKDNATVLFQFTAPSYQAFYWKKGESRAYQVNTAQFELSLLDISDQYIVLDLTVLNGDVKIADPSQMTVLAVSPSQNQSSSKLEAKIEDIEARLGKLETIVQNIQNNISQLKASPGVDPSINNRLSTLENKINSLQSVNPAEISDLENKITNIMQLISQLNNDVQSLKKEKSSLINNPQFQEMLNSDPKLAIIVVALDPTISDEQKQQILAQMVVKQKEQEQKAQQTALVISAVVIVFLIVGVVFWLKRRGASPYQI